MVQLVRHNGLTRGDFRQFAPLRCLVAKCNGSLPAFTLHRTFIIRAFQGLELLRDLGRLSPSTQNSRLGLKAACSVTNASDFSALYPCTCGMATCDYGFCDAGTSACSVSLGLVRSGRCQDVGRDITSLAACSAAASILSLGDTSASDDGQSGVSYDPPYCYFEGGSLKLNSDGSNYGSCSTSDECLCDLVPTLPAKPLTLQSSGGRSGRCEVGGK